mmetsp:Transcript_16757/g.14684  ORF Transcript_16757/g.14684 Transcript_16757/m.14684 type:complete len:163 (-) Transcript_16757:52-540(-)
MENKLKIAKFSEMMKNYDQKREDHKQGDKFDLTTSVPKTSKADAYLSEVTTKAFQMTLRVNSDDIEKKIPSDVLQTMSFFQHKHDKLLELFYNKFPIADGNHEDLKKTLGMKSAVVKLGKELIEVKNKYKEHKVYQKYTIVFSSMLDTLKKAHKVIGGLERM